MTRHALSLGVDTVVMLPPFYYKNVTDEGIFASYSEIVQRIGDPRLQDRALSHSADVAQPISHALIERLRHGLSGDHRRHQGFVRRLRQHDGDGRAAFPDFAVLTGADPLLLPLLRKGGAGCITATSNLIARDLAYVFKHFRDNDDDRTCAIEAAQARIVKARELVSRFAQMRVAEGAAGSAHRSCRLAAAAAAAGDAAGGSS